jgi:NAD(P)-dependent dehydrogenase (short-subunit alcohol dehydrogenase family)
MDLSGKVAVVTGGGSGLGAALCSALRQQGARVIVVDLDRGRAERVAAAVDGIAVEADVSREADVQRAIDAAREWAGEVDVMISNAGIVGPSDIFTDDADWLGEWNVHVMSNIYAARAVLPSMLERGEGWIVSTASAVGLTNQPGTASYVVTKHAQLALAEHLALQYGDSGVQFSCICPLGMRTGMTADASDDPANRFGDSTLIDADVAAARALEQLQAGRFLVLTHPEVATYAQRRASDHDRWLDGMRRLYARYAV